MKIQNDVLRKRRPRCHLRHFSGYDLSKWSDTTLHVTHLFVLWSSNQQFWGLSSCQADRKGAHAVQSSPSGKSTVFAYTFIQPRKGLHHHLSAFAKVGKIQPELLFAILCCKDVEPSLFGYEIRSLIILSPTRSTPITPSLLILLPPFSLMVVWKSNSRGEVENHRLLHLEDTICMEYLDARLHT